MIDNYSAPQIEVGPANQIGYLTFTTRFADGTETKEKVRSETARQTSKTPRIEFEESRL